MTTKSASVKKQRISDHAKFFLNWAKRPLTTGAIAASSPQLADRMAHYLNPDKPGMVLELGPGTGVVTQALLRRGFAAERIVSIEYNHDFIGLLKQRFHGVDIRQGDAYHFIPLLQDLAQKEFQGIISSLPLVAQPEQKRQALLKTALNWLNQQEIQDHSSNEGDNHASIEKKPFIQFSYSMMAPVLMKDHPIYMERSSWIWRNLPPARVWIYRSKS